MQFCLCPALTSFPKSESCLPEQGTSGIFKGQFYLGAGFRVFLENEHTEEEFEKSEVCWENTHIPHSRA